ncbi:MAG TPA: SMC-Scp complex subunit ScpB [Trueperaceae bacterium]
MPIATMEPSSDAEDSARREVRALLCAALLAAERPLSAKELKGLLGVSEEAVAREVMSLHEVLQAQGLGIEVEHVAGGYRLVVAPRLVPALATLLSPPPLPPLSSAALETLALIAYHQPITRGELEAARGASCTSTLETLRERGLIKVVGQKDVVGKPLLYGTTERFLLDFGLSSLEDLPPVGETPTGFLRG